MKVCLLLFVLLSLATSVRVKQLDFSESVVPNGEAQNRQWGNPVDGTAIILSNRNQLSTIAPPVVGSNANPAAPLPSKQRQPSSCSPNSVKLQKVPYSLQSLFDSKLYVSVPLNDVNASNSKEFGVAGTDGSAFVLVQGLALDNRSFISLQSVQNTAYFLRHETMKLTFSKQQASKSFKNTATFKAIPGLQGCRQGYVSLESNIPQHYLMFQSDSKQLVISKVTTFDDMRRASWKFTAPLTLPYTLVKAGPWSPQRGTIVMKSHAVKQRDVYSLMFWVRALGTKLVWANLLHRGRTNDDKSPAIFFAPQSTKLVFYYESSGKKITAPTELMLKEWTHIALVKKRLTTGKKFRILVFWNGSVLKSVDVDESKTSDKSADLYASDPWHHSGNCLMADVRWFNRAVSVDEVVQATKQTKFIADTARVYLGA